MLQLALKSKTFLTHVGASFSGVTMFLTSPFAKRFPSMANSIETVSLPIHHSKWRTKC
jgi:hypothetical protein